MAHRSHQGEERQLRAAVGGDTGQAGVAALMPDHQLWHAAGSRQGARCVCVWGGDSSAAAATLGPPTGGGKVGTEEVPVAVAVAAAVAAVVVVAAAVVVVVVQRMRRRQGACGLM